MLCSVLSSNGLRLQAGTQVTVTATLTDETGAIYKTAYLHFQPINCGGNLPVTGGSKFIVQDSFDLRPSPPSGTISGSVVGNDQILCGNVESDVTP